MLRLAEESVVLAISENTLDLELKDLLLLLLVGGLEVLRVIEETKSGVFDLLLVDTPGVTEVVQDASLSIQHVNCSLLGDVFETHDTIRDAG